MRPEYYETIRIKGLSARLLSRLLRDPRIRPIVIELYATGAVAEVLQQLEKLQPEGDAEAS